MKLIYERCPSCFPEDRLPYFQFEIRCDGEAFERPSLQCLRCKSELRVIGNKDEL